MTPAHHRFGLLTLPSGRVLTVECVALASPTEDPARVARALARFQQDAERTRSWEHVRGTRRRRIRFVEVEWVDATDPRLAA